MSQWRSFFHMLASFSTQCGATAWSCKWSRKSMRLEFCPFNPGFMPKSATARRRQRTLGLFFSADILVFDILHFVFFQVQYIHYCWKHYIERLRRNFYILFMEVSNWKENKEICTISFEVRIPMKKPKIFLESFYVSFRK